MHSLANPIDEDDGYSPLQGEKSIFRLMWNLTEPGPILLEDMIDMSGQGQAISGYLYINENPVPDDWSALESDGFDIRVHDLNSIYEVADE